MYDQVLEATHCQFPLNLTSVNWPFYRTRLLEGVIEFEFAFFPVDVE